MAQSPWDSMALLPFLFSFFCLITIQVVIVDAFHAHKSLSGDQRIVADLVDKLGLADSDGNSKFDVSKVVKADVLNALQHRAMSVLEGSELTSKLEALGATQELDYLRSSLGELDSVLQDNAPPIELLETGATFFSNASKRRAEHPPVRNSIQRWNTQRAPILEPLTKKENEDEPWSKDIGSHMYGRLEATPACFGGRGHRGWGWKICPLRWWWSVPRSLSDLYWPTYGLTFPPWGNATFELSVFHKWDLDLLNQNKGNNIRQQKWYGFVLSMWMNSPAPEEYYSFFDASFAPMFGIALPKIFQNKTVPFFDVYVYGSINKKFNNQTASKSLLLALPFTGALTEFKSSTHKMMVWVWWNFKPDGAHFAGITICDLFWKN